MSVRSLSVRCACGGEIAILLQRRKLLLVCRACGARKGPPQDKKSRRPRAQGQQ